MKKTIIWILITFFIVLIVGIGFNSLKITNTIEIKEYEIKDNFRNIKIINDTANIEFVPSSNSNSSVICSEQRNVNHSVKVEDNILLIQVNDTRKWYEHIGINFNTPKITIYLPENDYGELFLKSSTGDINIPNNFKFKSIDVLEDTGNIINYASVNENIKIKTSTGNIHIENIMANMVDLSTSTGKVDVIDVNCYDNIKINISTGNVNIVDTNCKNLQSKGSTGNISLKNVIATEKFSIERSTGDVKFNDSDANDIFVKTDTGNVTGNLLTDKVFFVETDTGNIDVPKVITDKKCEVITNTGDIKITVD